MSITHILKILLTYQFLKLLYSFIRPNDNFVIINNKIQKNMINKNYLKNNNIPNK